VRKLIDFLGLKFHATEYRWGRRLYVGKWYYIENSLVDFWSQKLILSCQGKVKRIEYYKENLS